MPPPPTPQLFVFRWRNDAGKETELSCWAANEREAEASALRAGWPGHDGSRMGRYRALLKRHLLYDEDF